MAIHVEANTIIAAELNTVADVEEWLDQAKALGATPEHRIEGFIAVQYAGHPSLVEGRLVMPVAQPAVDE